MSVAIKLVKTAIKQRERLPCALIILTLSTILVHLLNLGKESL